MKVGKVIIPRGCHPWPHELETAETLAANGHVVKFLKAADKACVQTADCDIDNTIWEMKAPRSSSLKAVERNLKRGKWQSSRIVFDARRMKKVPDQAIKRELVKHFYQIKGIKVIKFINHHNKIIDIK